MPEIKVESFNNLAYVCGLWLCCCCCCVKIVCPIRELASSVLDVHCSSSVLARSKTNCIWSSLCQGQRDDQMALSCVFECAALLELDVSIEEKVSSLGQEKRKSNRKSAMKLFVGFQDPSNVESERITSLLLLLLLAITCSLNELQTHRSLRVHTTNTYYI